MQVISHRFLSRLARSWVQAAVMVLCLAPILSIAREVPLTIICTTDLHGHVLPCADYEGNRDVGGLLRCASAIRDARERYPNVLYVDCGDLIQGSAESYLSRGRVMLKALEWLECDAWVVGNHDFDWGVDALGKLHDEAKTPLLGANVRNKPGTAPRLPKLRSHVIREVDGLRVALVGLTTPAISSWLTPDFLGDVLFEGSVESLRRVMPSVKADHPDIIVLLVHQGLGEFRDDHANEIEAIASRFPEIDLIIGGHTHKVRQGDRVNGIPFVQPGYYGNWLGRIAMVYDTVRRTLVKCDTEVIQIGKEWGECEELRRLLGDELRKAERYLSKVLSRCEEPLTASHKPPCHCPVQFLLASAMAEKSGAEVVLQGVFCEESLEAGPVTVADIWRLIPYENRVGLLSLTAAELREVLEENALQAGSHRFMGIWGLTYDLDLRAPPGSRVSNLRLPDGSPLHGRKRMRTAVGSYALASGGGRYPVLNALSRKPESRLEITDIDTRTAVLEYVGKRRRLEVSPCGGTMMKPGSE